MTRRSLTALALTVTLGLAACGGGSNAEGRIADAPTSTAPTATEPTPSEEATGAAPVEATTPAPEPEASEATVSFAMPNFTGANLQDAQDKVQELGIFLSVSHDLLGSRNQVIDSNWKVCDQTPAAGTRIKGKASDYEGKFDFGVVKLTESCP